MTERECRACGEPFAKVGPTDTNTLCGECRLVPVSLPSGPTLMRAGDVYSIESQLDHERRFAEGVRRGANGYYAWVAEVLGVDSVPRRGR